MISEIIYHITAVLLKTKCAIKLKKISINIEKLPVILVGCRMSLK